jgi:hypothetical protein
MKVNPASDTAALWSGGSLGGWLGDDILDGGFGGNLRVEERAMRIDIDF